MKKLFYLLFLVQLVACQTKNNNEGENPKIKETKTEQQNSSTTNFGETFESDGVISTKKLLTILASQDTLEAKVKAEIVEVCKVKGCWMNVSLENGDIMKVMFKDHSFALPKKGLEGKTTVFNGLASRKQISVEDLRHYAKDAGRPEAEIAAITAPKEEIFFQATGVKIIEN
ncbi:DUF4920 domain-containing protein [Xanthovirga aplysinae]|uniref:DUF4920 domain-containing protein n=1 Tax=Xanthovirga aplysinae TaxID=2529853 RepID=UPI0012BD3E6E|nr:DUF4920 domain-containing protein [Xanthovirga aplysinae]MTI31697.1 DUF4920 domain-containing protein [Xanthovirga aplysinae]